MTEQHDVHLQRAFDERLLRVLPPPRGRRRRSARRTLALSLAVLLTASGLVFAADVNRTADAAGESCADVLAKVELWFEAVRSGTTQQQLDFKKRTAELIGAACPAKTAGAVETANVPKGELSKNVTKPAFESTDPGCVAAQHEIRAWAEANPNAPRAELLAFKERANKLLESACAPTGGR